MEELRVDELIDGLPIFESTGLSKIKVTKDGVTKTLVIKIRSTGIADLIDSFIANAPKPPDTKILVEPGTPLAKEMGISKKRWVRMLDLTNEDYIQEKSEHDRNLGIAIMLQGLDIEIKDKEEKVITDSDKKIEVLKKQGLTGDQFVQIVKDINSLTAWAEVKEKDFLDESWEKD